MRLVADASTLVAEAMRVRGQALLENDRLEIVISEAAWEETRLETSKRLALLIDRKLLTVDQAELLWLKARSSLTRAIRVVPTKSYDEHLPEAAWRLPRDLKDQPSVALAIALECGIWTADLDFFGCGVAAWSTETLLAWAAQ